MSNPGRSAPIRFAAILFVWFLIGLFLVSLRTVSDYWLEGALLEPSLYLQIFAYEMFMVLAWALVTPGILTLSQRHVGSKKEAFAVAALHIALFAAFLCLKALLLFTFGVLVTARDDVGFGYVASATLDWIELNVITYGLVALAGYAMKYHEKYRMQDMVQRRLERQLASIEFDGLKMQAQPEFLIRSLQRVSATLDTSPDAAEELITRLSSLLRNTLMHANTEQVPLEEEISMFEDYLHMQQVAYPDFGYQVEVEPEAWVFKVPAMVLQPLVETLMTDGADSCRSVELQVSVQQEWLRLDMKLDSSSDESQGSWAFEGNMERIRKRLRRLYEGGHVLNLVRKDGGRSEIMLLLPLEAANKETEYYAVY